ncbi:MAG: hypothetical protein ACLUOI_27475 [Eisenbergiella sp.]
MGEDFIRTARAKGLSEKAVLFKHGLRNARFRLPRLSDIIWHPVSAVPL